MIPPGPEGADEPLEREPGGKPVAPRGFYLEEAFLMGFFPEAAEMQGEAIGLPGGELLRGVQALEGYVRQGGRALLAEG
jgi:hypothetical protein